MKKRVLCLTALMVGSLGMAACGGGKQGQEEAQVKDVNGIEEAQKQEAPEAREQEAEEAQGPEEARTQEAEDTKGPEEAGTQEAEDVEATQKARTQEPEDVEATEKAKTQAQEEAQGAGQEPGGKQEADLAREQELRVGENQQGEQTAGQESGQEEESGTGQDGVGTDVDGSQYVRTQETAEEYKAADGTLLLIVERAYPVVDMPDRKEAAQAINAYIREGEFYGGESIAGMSEEELFESAEMDYKERGKDNWYGEYSYSTGYRLGRMDDKAISFLLSSYFYLGGAHPNTFDVGLTFDAQTGQRLLLADVVQDEAAAVEAAVGFLIKETEKEEYGGVFFSNYKDSLAGLVADGSWYLGEDGFHIIANTYAIAPYVAGSFDFVIPYGEADFLKEEYR